MKKNKILEQIKEHFEKERDLYQNISKQARADAIDGEMKQEGKYDTRAIEASYLAGAQAHRLQEIKEELFKLNSFKLENCRDNIFATGSLLLLESEDVTGWYFISPTAGGFSVNFGDEKIKIISLQSPFGKKIISLNFDDDFFELKLPSGLKEFEILEKK